MNYPSVKTISTRLNLDRETAKRVRGLIDGSIDPMTVPETEAWVRQCYNRPSRDELILDAVSHVMGAYGTEAIFDDSNPYWPRLAYVNVGDSYADTVVFDRDTEQYRVTSWVDIVRR